MKFNKIFKALCVVLTFIFLFVFVYMGIYRVDHARQLSSNELTPEVLHRIRIFSWLFTYLIFYLICLGAYAFVSVFKFLVSPHIGGNIYKVISIILIYITCIVLTFRGYNILLNVNYMVELTAALTEPSIKTSYCHMIIISLLYFANYLKKSIRKENYRKHKAYVTKTNLYHRHVEFRDIIDRKVEDR